MSKKAKQKEKPIDQSKVLEKILKIVDTRLYGSILSGYPGDDVDEIDDCCEEIGLARYKYNDKDYSLDELRWPALRELYDTVQKTLTSKEDRGRLLHLCFGHETRAYAMARGGFAIGVFLGARVAGASDEVIERLGKQFLKVS